MCHVPQADEILTGLADVLRVVDLAGEHTGQVEPVAEGRVGPVLDVERALESNGGRPDPQTVHLDGASGAEVFDELVTQLLHRQLHRTFHKARGTREPTDELRLLDSVPLFDTGPVGIDG